jgi:hypothetical protein
MCHTLGACATSGAHTQVPSHSAGRRRRLRLPAIASVLRPTPSYSRRPHAQTPGFWPHHWRVYSVTVSAMPVINPAQNT